MNRRQFLKATGAALVAAHLFRPVWAQEKALDGELIQEALNRGGVVRVPEGVYAIRKPLLIHDNTHLILSPGTILRREFDINHMIRNVTNGAGGYNGARNITVEGGLWDANKERYPSQCTAMVFGHTSGVTIRDLTIRGVWEWHHIELNGVRNATVKGCAFLDWDGPDPLSRPREAIQIDLMYGQGGFPWFGPYDSTPCEGVTIEGCTFQRLSEGIGTHNAVPGIVHRDITIRKCHFDGLTDDAVKGLNFEDVRIEENEFADVLRGVRVAGDRTVCRRFEIIGNKFHDLAPSEVARAIWIEGTAEYPMSSGKIHRNVIEGIGRHAISVDYGIQWDVAWNEVAQIGRHYADGVGLYLYQTQRSAIYHNRVEDCSGEAIRLHSCENCIVALNTADSIRLSKTRRVSVYHNWVKGHVEQSGVGNQVFANAISG